MDSDQAERGLLNGFHVGFEVYLVFGCVNI